MLGVVALVATAVGVITGNPFLIAIGTLAGIGSAVATMGAQLLTKPPPARGTVTSAIWDPNAPTPYGIGEGYLGPVVRYDVGYGGTLDKVVNPYRWQVHVYSGGGPVGSITPYVDFTTIGAYYSGWIETDTQPGACPEGSALTPPMGAAPDWGASYKLSGLAAIGWNFKFDKKGKVFANGLPTLGAYGQWAKVYDPRLDSTFPGGSGSCRLGTESTYVWSENPALHFGTYAYGRYQNGKLVMGVGLPVEGIDFTTIAAWATVCETNAWTIFGRVFEPADRWQNLRDIAAAGGAVPAFAGAVLSVNYSAPRVALDTITEADIADEAMAVTYMQSYRNRLNTIIPKYTSADHDWQQVSAAPVVVSSYLTEDGEERREEWPFNLVKNANQAAQLARYIIEDSRELHPIQLVCMPRMRGYRPGDCLHVNLPQLGLDHDAVIQSRSIDPATGKVTLTLISETPGKHSFALGQTGAPPATPALTQTSEEADSIAYAANDRQVAVELPGARLYSADYTGAVQSPPLPDTITPKVTIGGVDMTTDDAVTYALAASTGITASVNNTTGDPAKGTVTITAVTALNGWLDLTATVNGVAQPAKRIVIQKQTGLAPGFGGTGAKIANDNSFPALTSTTFVALTDTLTVTLATGETLYGTAPLDYVVTGSANRSVTAKWQHSPAGAGTWTDFDGGAVTGSVALFATGDPGHGDFNDSAASLAAGDYDVRMVAEISGTGTATLSGTATIEAKT